MNDARPSAGWGRAAVAACIGIVGLALTPGCQSPSSNGPTSPGSAGWSGLGGGRTPPVEQISQPEQMALLNRAQDLLLTAAQGDMDVVSCNAIEALVQVAPRDGLVAFRQAVRSASPLVRYAGYVAIGDVRDKSSMAAIIAGTQDQHAHVRLAAAFAACRCGRDGYARLLVKALTEGPEDNLRADAAALLGRLGEQRATKWLKTALHVPANEKSKHVILNIHSALAKLGQAESLRELIRYSQGDVATRNEALLLLADLGDPTARDALRYRFQNPGEDYVEARLIAARGLGRIGYADGFDLAMQMLGFTDPNPRPDPDNPSRTYPVRSMAVHALAEMRDPRALGPLRTLAAAQDDPRLQVAAAYAICRILQPRAPE